MKNLPSKNSIPKHKVPDAESTKKMPKLPERGGRTAKHEKVVNKGGLKGRMI